MTPAQFATFPNAEVDELSINTGPFPSAPQGYTQNTYQLQENLTYVRGRHTLRGGIEIRKYIDTTIFLPRARGEWDWANLNSFLNDFVPDGNNGALKNVGNGTFVGNDNAFAGFLLDDLKVTSRLTLNLGLRYEYFGTPRDANRERAHVANHRGFVFRHRTDLTNQLDDFRSIAPYLGTVRLLAAQDIDEGAALIS